MKIKFEMNSSIRFILLFVLYFLWSLFTLLFTIVWLTEYSEIENYYEKHSDQL
jgi:hypothetical protein